MKILIFNTYYFPKFVGGAEISVQLLAEGLVKSGNDVYVVTFAEKFSIDRVNNVIVIRMKQRNVFSYFTSNRHKKITKLIWHLLDSFNPFYVSFVKEIIKKINPDIVHTNNILGFSPSLWAVVKSQKIPLVHTLRDYYLLCHRCNLNNNGTNCDTLCKDCNVTQLIKSSFINYPDHFVGVSDFILKKHDHLIDNNKVKTTIYNAVDCEIYNKSLPESKKIILGFIGRVSTDKGIGFLIDSLARCSEQTKNKYKLLIAGHGDPDYIKELKNKDNTLDIEFLGVVKSSEFYKSIHVLMIPSLWYEPFGRIAIEALSHNVPVCMSNRGGLNEIYNSRNSWQFKPETYDLMSILENDLVDIDRINDKRRYCLSGLNRFSESDYIKNYQVVYNEVIQPGNSVEIEDKIEINLPTGS